jgi:hypothetical protein
VVASSDSAGQRPRQKDVAHGVPPAEANQVWIHSLYQHAVDDDTETDVEEAAGPFLFFTHSPHRASIATRGRKYRKPRQDFAGNICGCYALRRRQGVYWRWIA